MAKKGKGKKNKASKDHISSFSDMDSTESKIIMIGPDGEGSICKPGSFKSFQKHSMSPNKAQYPNFLRDMALTREIVSRMRKDDIVKLLECKDCGGRICNEKTSSFMSQPNSATNSITRNDDIPGKDYANGLLKTSSSNDKLNKISNSFDLMTEQLRKFCETIQVEIDSLNKQKEEAEIKASEGICGIDASLQNLRKKKRKCKKLNKEKLKIESEVYCIVKKLIHPQVKDYYSEEKETKIIEKTVEILQNKEDDSESESLQTKIRNYVLKMKVRNKLGLKLSKWVGYSKLPKELTDCESDKEKDQYEEHMLIQITTSRKTGKKDKR